MFELVCLGVLHSKYRAIYAILKGGYVNTLVSDDLTDEILVNLSKLKKSVVFEKSERSSSILFQKS